MTTLAELRRFAIARSLFPETTLLRAVDKLGFVQADPIRAPARAQDLTLRHRVRDYRTGDLERRYPKLPLEEDFFVNYGFLPRATQALMHPRPSRSKWVKVRPRDVDDVLAFVRERGVVHPREVDERFQHGRITNWFGGTSSASTQLLDDMHYQGLLRVAGRVSGIRTYAARDRHEPASDPDAALDTLVDVIVRKYAPLPERSLAELVSFLRRGVPQWAGRRRAALERAEKRLARVTIDGVTWLWPEGEDPRASEVDDDVRLLAPFDPVVWDRRRFELLWGWAYRFEAYTPPAKRVRGYYALPLLWRDRVIGWGNASVAEGELSLDLGYVSGRPPRDAAFRRALDEERAALASFLRP